MQSCLLRKLIQLLELCVVQPVSEQWHIHVVLDAEMPPIRLPAANVMHTTVTVHVCVVGQSKFHAGSLFIVVVPLMRVELILLTGTRV